MTWIRDNLLKIAIILGILIFVIIIISVLSSLGGGSSSGGVTASGYEQLENKVQSAAKKYLNDNRELLPKTTNRNTTIKLETLQKNDYIGTVYSVDDDNVTCTGYVEVAKTSEDKKDYKIYPYLSCGRYYKTMSIADYIKENDTEIIEGVGLYKSGNDWVYKGEKPKNYLSIDGKIYRILSVLEDGKLKVISAQATKNTYMWDDRFNSDVNKYYGINNFQKSRMKDTLVEIYNKKIEDYNDAFFSDIEKEYIIDHEFCVGKIAFDTKLSELKSKECSETATLKVGLINASDYVNASADTNCNALTNKQCNNYNYLYSFNNKTFALINSYSGNSYSYLAFSSGDIITKKANSKSKLYPTFYLSEKNLYKSGDGTKENPYILR